MNENPKPSYFYDPRAILASGIAALISFIYFYYLTAELAKSFAAGIFVFLLVWLAYTVVVWIFKIF